VRLDPKSALTHVDRGAIYQAEGDLDRAIADYDEAIEIDPNYANAFLTRANAYRGKHDLERAKQDLEVALRLDPQLAAAKDALDDTNRLIAKSAAPPIAAPPMAPPAPAASPMLLVLLMPIALIGLFAIVAMHLFSKAVDKSLAVADDAPKRSPRSIAGSLPSKTRMPNIGGVSFVAATPVPRASSRASGPAHSAGSPAASGPPSCCRPSTRSNRRTAAPTTISRKQ
jgi:TPR repeat